MVEEIFLRYGFPETIVSDNYSSFTGETMKKITKLLKLNHVFCSPYNPKSNVVERYHKTLGNYLRAYTEKQPMKWESLLPFASFSYNTSVSTATKYSPFEMVFGKKMLLPISNKNLQFTRTKIMLTI